MLDRIGMGLTRLWVVTCVLFALYCAYLTPWHANSGWFNLLNYAFGGAVLFIIAYLIWATVRWIVLGFRRMA